MFSATIDQSRLRRAMRRPFDRQKVSSSGFQSLIHRSDVLLSMPRP